MPNSGTVFCPVVADFPKQPSTFIIHQRKGNHQCLCSPTLYSSAKMISRVHMKLFQALSILQSNVFHNHFIFFLQSIAISVKVLSYKP